MSWTSPAGIAMSKTAVAAAREAVRHFAGADLAFKKIDSLLRGHWAAELAGIVSSGMFRRIVLTPAFPAQGRLTRRGHRCGRNRAARPS